MFRCTSCGRRLESPVVMGTGDCPDCGGDVVFDFGFGETEKERLRAEPGLRSLLRRLLRR
jgi:predicted  nucleic acid-binding Zn-ribbon protein